MRIKFILPLICFFVLSKCSVDSTTDNTPKEIEIYQWHLINVSGGLAGVDIDYDLETIIWVFNVGFSGNGTLQIENNNTDDTLEDGFDSGTYDISIPIQNSKSYLFVENNEFGEMITPTDSDLIINQNNMMGGTGADGYIYTFKRKIVIITIESGS